MAAEAFKGRSATDNLTEFLAQVTLYLSAIGFFIQVALTSRIHRYLGVGFALLVLPTSLGVTGVVMLLNAALWAPALARILDTSLRYTLDKTTREVLFLPLPTALKYRAKPFVDVTVDRFAKGLAALLALVLIKPWGLGLNWQQISYASLAVMALWVVTAVRARREYLAHLPPQHRAAGGGGLGGAARPRRPRDGGGARRGARPPRRAAGALRHRPARGPEPPPAGDAAAAAPRVGEGAGAGPAGAGGGPARAAGALGGRGRAPPEGRERRGAGRRGARARRDPRGARGRADAALPGRPRPACGHHGRGHPRRQRARGGRRGGRGGASSASPRTRARRRPRAGGRWRPRSAGSPTPASDRASSP